MKTIITFLSIIISSNLWGQNCDCKKDTLLKNLISCDPIIFDNNANLSWSFNCDSSWLTFQDVLGKKTVIFSLGDGLVHLTERLGYIFAFEYDKTFLIQNNVISGCCSPPTFFLYDKSTGSLKKKLGRIIFYNTDRTKPFIISVTNSTYDATNSGEYQSLSVYNIDNDKTFFIELPKGQINKALERTQQMYPEYLFDKPKLNGETLTLTYYLKKPNSNSKKPTRTISFDLN